MKAKSRYLKRNSARSIAASGTRRTTGSGRPEEDFDEQVEQFQRGAHANAMFEDQSEMELLRDV